MRFAALLVLALALGACSALLVACGDRNNLIPAEDARGLNRDLDDVAVRVDSRACGRARAALANAREKAQRLPDEVDAKLRANIDQGLAHLAAQVTEECTRTTTTRPTQTRTTTTETLPPPPTTEPEPPPTTERPPPPTTTEPPPTPPDDGSGTGGTPPGGGGGGTPGDE